MAKRDSLKISVVVTTHERPDFLRKVLAAYLHQTRCPDELIVADDGSGQPTADVVNTFIVRAPFPVVHAWQEHSGVVRLSHLRNLATRSSNGDYVIYTDGDCVPTRHFVADHERLARPGWFTQGKRMWVKYKALEQFTGRESFGRMLWLAKDGGLSKPHWLIHLSGLAIEKREIRGVRGCNMAFFRKNIELVNGHNEDFVGFWRQDSEFVLRIMRSGVRRQDAVFSSMLFHLEHEKEFITEDFERNSALLAEAHTAPLFVRNGLNSVQTECDTRYLQRKAA